MVKAAITDDAGAHYQHIPCLDETESRTATPVLDELWEQAQTMAHTEATRERPHFCFSPVPVVMIACDGGIGRVLGLYDAEHNKALIAVTRDEIDRLLRCSILHEMGHALLGDDDAKVFKTFGPCPPEGHS